MRKKLLAGFLCSLFFSFPSHSQPDSLWSLTFGGESYDTGIDVVQSHDMCFIVTGTTASFGFGLNDIFIIKIESEGSIEWQRTYGTRENDVVNSLAMTADSGYVITGFTEGFGNGGRDAYILKNDSEGTRIWDNAFGGRNDDEAKYIKPYPEGGYVIAGYTYSYGEGGSDCYLLKISDNGHRIWQRMLGAENDDVANSVQVTQDGGFIVAGWTESAQGNADFYLVKTNRFGIEEWSQTYGGDEQDGARSISQTTDGGFLLAGYTKSFGEGTYDGWIIKTDCDGNIEWDYLVEGEESESIAALRQTPDGGYVALGLTGSIGAGAFDLLLLKLDENGNLKWQQLFGGEEDDWSAKFILADDGGYFIAGGTDTFGAGWSDAWFVKTNIDPDFMSPYWWPTFKDTLFFENDTLFLPYDLINEYIYSPYLPDSSLSIVVIDGHNIFCDYHDDGYKIYAAADWLGIDSLLFTINEIDNENICDSAYLRFSVLEFNSITAQQHNQLPENTYLSPYPNPFNSTTTIHYRVGANSNSPVTLSIYDLSGQLVENLVDQYLPVGIYSVNWDAGQFASGIYFVNFYSERDLRTAKLVMVK